MSRKVKYNNGKWQEFWVKGQMNPCNCGSNLFHKVLTEDNKVIGVCNACGKDIYQCNHTDEEIADMEWVKYSESKIAKYD